MGTLCKIRALLRKNPNLKIAVNWSPRIMNEIISFFFKSKYRLPECWENQVFSISDRIKLRIQIAETFVTLFVRWRPPPSCRAWRPAIKGLERCGTARHQRVNPLPPAVYIIAPTAQFQSVMGYGVEDKGCPLTVFVCCLLWKILDLPAQLSRNRRGRNC